MTGILIRRGEDTHREKGRGRVKMEGGRDLSHVATSQ